MQQIVLQFPLLNGGRAGGINSADLETFAKDPSYYVARECAQNTLDALAPGKNTVELEFILKEIPIDKIPCLANLTDVFKKCKAFRTNDKDLRDFCDKGIDLLKKNNIPVLIISDYNTTGLIGSDTEVDGRWYGLIKSEGSSNKDPDAGGSFGIGKAAPIGASMLRTVYYSTKTDKGYAFQGVSNQTTHKNKDGKKTQSVGYIGYYNNSPGKDENYFPAVRDKSAIPKLFLRDKIGTSIFIPGYIDATNWKDNIIKSLLNDFWLAVFQGKMSFKIGDIILDKSNVESHIKQLIGTEGFTADRFHKAFIKGTCFKETLNDVKNVKLYLIEEEELPDKKVAYMRKNSMLIYENSNFRFRKSFTGLFLCDNDDGNKIFRAMEPPKHDEWQPLRLLSRYPSLDGQKILDSIRQLINAKIKELVPLSITPQFEIDDIKKYLPYSDDDSGTQSDGNKKQEDKETFKKIVAEAEPVTIIPFSKTSDLEKNKEGNENIPGGTGQGGHKPGPPHPGPIPPPGPVPGPGPSPAIKARIKSRILSYSNGDKSYLIAFTAQNTDFNGDIYLHSVGDDSESDMVKITNAISDNNSIPINRDGSIPMKLPKDKTRKIKINVENNEELSLRFIYGN